MTPAANVALRVLAGLFGTWITVGTFLSAVKLVVVPRSGSQRITRFVFGNVRHLVARIAPPSRDFVVRDRWYSMYAPVSLVMMPFTWLFLLTMGFGLIHWAALGHEFLDALTISGSSALTLGVAFDRSFPDPILSFIQAGMGIMLGSLLISYLPTVYQSYQRRETLVGMLESRAGLPPSPIEALTRYQRIGALDIIDDDLFARWEKWFADIEESHTSVAALVFFRSPQLDRSWITAAGAVLDTASIMLSCVDRPFSGRTALCLRQGFMCLQRIADYFEVTFNERPQPDDPISVSRRDFDLMWIELVAADLPLKSDRDRAWADFRGWRVNYDTVLVALCELTVAPDGRWSSDRLHQPG